VIARGARHLAAALAALVLGCAALPASAQQSAPAPIDMPELDAETRTAIDDLLALTGAMSMVDRIVDPMIQQFIAASDQQAISAGQEPLGDAEKQLIAEEVAAAMRGGMDQLREMTVAVYARHFSASEVRQIADIYRTPIGQRMLAEMPLLMQDSMNVGLVWAQNLTPKIQANIRKRLDASAS